MTSLPGQEAQAWEHWQRIGEERMGLLELPQGASRGNPNPSGICWCGCGEKTKRTKQCQRTKNGDLIYKGNHNLYCHGHGRRKLDSITPNPSGICWCGCGEKTPIATKTNVAKKSPIVEGLPIRYIPGHPPHTVRHALTPPNPSGLCMCGCGQPAPISSKTNQRLGWVKGEATRYIHNHQTRLNDPDSPNVRRRKQIMTNGGTHEPEEIAAMLRDQEGLCAYCEIPLEGAYHVDHMIPLSRGGRNDWTNLAVTCPPCNQRKNRRTAEEFMCQERSG